MGSLLIVTGPPGAGKSTVAEKLAASYTPSVLVDGDQFFGFFAEGFIPPWFPESHHQNGVATDAAGAAAGRYAADYHTIYDGIIGPWFLDRFVLATGLDEVDYVIIRPSVDVCIERVRTRFNHSFSDESATVKMHAEFSEAAVDRRHLLTDDRATVDAIVDEIRNRRADHLLRYDPTAVS